MVLGLFRWLRSLVGAVLVLAGGLALTEVALRVQSLPATTKSSAKASSNDFPLAVPSWQLGWELRPSSQATVAAGRRDTVIFRTNSLGLRGEEVAIPKPAGLYRIVCLGDETLLAPEIADDANFCHLLQVNLQARTQQPIEVINAALPHGCPLTEWLLFRSRLLALQPDLVLVHVTWSDLADDRNLRRYTTCDPHGVPVSCSHPRLAAKPCVNLGAWRQQFRVIDWGCEQLWCKVEDAAPGRTAPSIWSNVEATAKLTEFQQMVEPLKHLSQLCEGHHSRCVVWTTPAPWQISGTATAKGSARREAGVPRDGLITSRVPIEALSRTLAEWRVPCLDASGAFSSGSAADAMFLPDAPRWSVEGHARVAQFVADQLAQHLPGPWSNSYSRPQAVPASYTQQHPSHIGPQ
jgi:hypothetical protein